MRFLYARFTNRKTHATGSREYTFTSAATGRLMRNQKNLLKALATSQSTFRVLFPLNKPKWKSACKSSENWAAVSLVYRYILNYSDRFQIPLIIQRHLQGTDLFERKRLPKKKYRHSVEGLDSKFFVVVSTSCVCANHSEIFPRSRLSWPAF